MNIYDVIIHNEYSPVDDKAIQKITIQIRAPDKDYARSIGEAIARTILPLSKTAIEVEFRRKET